MCFTALTGVGAGSGLVSSGLAGSKLGERGRSVKFFGFCGEFA